MYQYVLVCINLPDPVQGYRIPDVEGGTRPPPSGLALLAQVLQSITGHEIPVSNLSDPTSETALVYLITIIDDGSAREEVPQILNSWHPSLRRTAAADRPRHPTATRRRPPPAACSGHRPSVCH